MPTHQNINSASAYFNEQWQRYQSTVKNNTLHHREMLAALQEFLLTHLENKMFSFVDVGCGDSSTVAPVLAKTKIKKYTGIDEANNVLQLAPASLAPLHAEKEFIADNMTTGILKLSEPVDIIFSSYAVHHLSLQDKTDFIVHCQQKLNDDGFLLMVDGIRKEKQSRDEWLLELKQRMEATLIDADAEEINFRMQHPRADDHPETIATFAKIAQEQSWKSFKILVDKGICAFMVFEK